MMAASYTTIAASFAPPPSLDPVNPRSSHVYPLPCGLVTINDPDGTGQIVFPLTFSVWLYNVFILLRIVVVPMYIQEAMNPALLAAFLIVAALTLACLFKAAATDPGRIPYTAHPSTYNLTGWTDCIKCQIKRPPKAHHCRRCGHCVRGMDHHCPWINNCVGEDNRGYFTQLVFYATLLSFFALYLIYNHFYVYPVCSEEVCDKTLFVFQNKRWLLYSSFCLAIFVLMTCFSLFMTQICGAILGYTTIDIMTYRYGIGSSELQELGKNAFIYKNLSHLFGSKIPCLWLLPCKRRRSETLPYSYQNIV